MNNIFVISLVNYRLIIGVWQENLSPQVENIRWLLDLIKTSFLSSSFFHNAFMGLILSFVFFLAFTFIYIIAYLLQERFNYRFSKSKSFQKDLADPKLLELSEKFEQDPVYKLTNYEVIESLPVPNSDDLIVLFKPSIDFYNVIRCHSNGSLVWVAELPEVEIPCLSADVYVGIQWRNGCLSANTWSCYLITLDVETGKALKIEFTK